MQLTWDETDHERVTAMNRTFNKDELLGMDFDAYLASSSEEEGGGVEFGQEENEAGGEMLPWKLNVDHYSLAVHPDEMNQLLVFFYSQTAGRVNHGGEEKEAERGADLQVQRAAQGHPGQREEAAGGQRHGDGDHLGARYNHAFSFVCSTFHHAADSSRRVRT